VEERYEIGLRTASPAPDYELTCVEPGSPMGELMRRYWQPVCTSDGSALSTRIARIAAPLSNGAASRKRGCADAITAVHSPEHPRTRNGTEA
jgi:hypothetical protein